MNSLLPSVRLINTSVAALPLEGQLNKILDWASRRESRSVCLANVHMVMEAHNHAEFGRVLERADLVVPDGMPLVWLMKALGVSGQERVAGMDVFLKLCGRAAEQNLKVFFLGSQDSVLDRMREHLSRDFPELEVVGWKPLPMIPANPELDEESIREINASGASLVFVSLGCPKQERWMDIHRGKIQATMIGLGGVFPIYAGIQKWAPKWMRDCGLEWLFRWMQEPRRLTKRYVLTNSAFIWHAGRQILRSQVDLMSQKPWISSYGSKRRQVTKS